MLAFDLSSYEMLQLGTQERRAQTNNGDNVSQESLIQSFVTLRKALERVVRGIVPPKDIEDIVQETYVRACQAECTTEIRAPRSFLYKTARNLAIDYAKRAENRLYVDQDTPPDHWHDEDVSPDPTFAQVCSDEEFRLFCDAVRHLPAACRRTFVLKKVYGYSQREIAEELNISISTVEKQVAEGIKRCTYYMEQQNEKGVSHLSQAQQLHDTVKTLRSRR